MAEGDETTERHVQTLRCRLDAIGRRQRASCRQAHEFALRRLNARLVSSEVKRDDA
jgi:hypothetical protein